MTPTADIARAAARHALRTIPGTPQATVVMMESLADACADAVLAALPPILAMADSARADAASITVERDAANARADQAIRFAAGVEEECARLTEALWKVVVLATDTSRTAHSALREAEAVARAARRPITHDLPSDGRETDG